MSKFVSCCFGSSSIKTIKPAALLTTETSLLLTHDNAYTSEKSPSYRRPKTDVAADIIDVLYSATVTSCNATLQEKLETIIHEAGWWDEAIAKAVLTALERTLQAGKSMNSVMQEAYNSAIAEAKKIDEIKADHPILMGAFLTIVALGVLYLVWPAVLAALGFGEEGIVLGSFAARWQSFYPDVPVGSVFAFLQRLGMTLKFKL